MRLLKKIGLLSGAFIIILVLVVATVLFLALDTDRYKVAIEERLSKITGMEVTINHLRLGILRGVAFEGRDITLKDPRNPYPHLTIDKLSLGLKTRPLLTKQVIIKRLHLKRPILRVATGPDPKEIKVRPLVAQLLGVTSQAAAQGFFLEVRAVTIKDGEVVFYQSYDGEEQKTVLGNLKNLAVKLSGLKTRAPTRYALSGQLLFRDNSMNFALRGVTNDLPTRFDPALVAVEGTGRFQNVPGRLVKSFLMPQGPVQALEGTFDISTHYRGNLGGAIDAEGDVQFTSLYIDYPKLFKDPLRADKGTIKYALTFKDDALMVRRFEIASKETALRGSFTIENITSGHGSLTGELSTTALSAESVVKLLPPASSPGLKGLVKSMKPSGEMEVKRLEATGPFQTLQTDKKIGPIVTASADFVLKNLGLTFGPDIPPFKNWEGEISYNGREITFEEVGGRVGEESRIETLNGTIRDIASENPTADLTIITHLRAGDFRKHIQRWLNRKQSPMLSQETIIKGAVHTDLAVVGPLKRLSHLNVSGLIILDRISITDPVSKLALENIMGVLRARGDRIEVESLTIVSKDNPISLSGQVLNYMGDAVSFQDVTVDLGEGLPKLEGLRGSLDKLKHVFVIETGKPIVYNDARVEALRARITGLNASPLLELSFRGILTASQVYKLAALVSVSPERSPLLQALNGASGDVEVTLSASGPLRKQPGATWTAQLSFDKMTFPPTHPLGRLRSLSGKLNLNADTLTITVLTATVGTSEVGLHGSIQGYLLNDPHASLTVETSGLEIADAVDSFALAKEVPGARGSLKGRITASGPLLTRPEDSRFEGFVNIAEGYLDLDQLPSIENLTAQLELRQGEAMLKEARFTFMDSPVSLSASLKGFREPLITVRTHFKHLDLDQLPLSAEGQGPWAGLIDRALVFSERSLDNAFIRRSALNLDLGVEQGKFQSSTFGPLTSKATLKGQKLTVKEAEINTAFGLLNGKGYFDFSGDDPTIFALKGALVDGDARRVVGSWGPEWDVVTGILNVNTSLKCREEGIIRGLLGCLQGHLIVRLNDGHIRKTGIIEPLAEKLNFSRSFKHRLRDPLPTLRYHTISGDFAIHDGLLTTNNFAINGSKIKIATDGQVNLFLDTMDLKVSVLTFHAVDQVVHKIPIINLVAEDDKSLVATYYEVSGGVEEPQVVSIPNRSMEMALIRTFHKIFQVPGRIIRAPIDLLNQLPSPEGGTSTPASSPSDN